jgi:hypothetical protein
VDRRLKIVRGPYEVETLRILEEAASKYAARVWPKVRMADVLNVSHSGISSEEYGYALRAHFDFTVTDEESHAQFAVEFDGRSHNTDPDTIRRDALKNSICERLGFPLLRIGDEFFQRVGSFILLGWLAEVWFLRDSFERAQASGHIAQDEIFDYGAFISPAYIENGRVVEIGDLALPEQLQLMQEHKGEIGFTMPYDPFQPAHAYISRTFVKNSNRDPFPKIITGTDPAGFEVAVAILKVRDGRFLMGHARVRSFRFEPVSPSELAFELAVVDIANKLKQYREGTYTDSPKSDVDMWRHRIERWQAYR